MTKILEGGVQRAGDRVRINVQLIDAATDAHLWAESYDRELTAANIFAIQSEVAAAIAGALKATLTAERAGAGRTRTDAESRGLGGLPARQAAHGQAHQRGARRGRAVLPQGDRPRSEVRARVRRTGGHADACRSPYSGAPQESAPRQSREGGGRGAGVGPEPGRGLGFRRAALRASGAQFERAESMFRRAIELNPNYAHGASLVQQHAERRSADGTRRSRRLQRAVELDPLSAVINSNLGVHAGRT